MPLKQLLTYERRTSTGAYLEGITGLRAVAALWVLGFHSWGISQGPTVHIPLPFGAHVGVTWLFRAGGQGVDIFFVISGFLLSQPWITARPARQAWRQIPKFYGRRLLRIIPAYYAVIFFVLYACLFGLGPCPSTWHVLVQVFMLNGLLDVLNIDPYLMRYVFWTLHAEIAFYIILPFIAVAAHRFGWKAVITAMIVFSIGFRWYLFHRFHETDFFKMHFLYSMPGRLDQFGIGMICARLFNRQRQTLPVHADGPRWTGWAEVLFWLGLVALLVMGRVSDWRGDMVQKGDWLAVIFPTLTAGGAALIVASIARQGKSALRLLANPIMIFLGTISYSLYVWHTVFLDMANKAGILAPFGGMGSLGRVVILVFPLIILVSWGCYWWVERPFLKIRHHAAEGEKALTTGRAIGWLAGCGIAMVVLAGLMNGFVHR